MAIAFYIPSINEDEPVKPNQGYQSQQQQQPLQQQQQQQHHQQQSDHRQENASSAMSQQVQSADYMLMLFFHEILVTYARDAVLAQQATTVPSPSPCLMCKKLYYLFRRLQ